MAFDLDTVKLGILEVLRDGGAAAINDLPSLLASSPKDTEQRVLKDVKPKLIAEALVALQDAGLVVNVDADVVAWTGIDPEQV